MADADGKAKGTNLQVVGVETLDDALAALKAIGGSGLPGATVPSTAGVIAAGRAFASSTLHPDDHV